MQAWRAITLGIIVLGGALLAPLAAFAEGQAFDAGQGNVQALLIRDEDGYARGYGVFTRGLARLRYDETSKTLDNLKFSLALASLASSTLQGVFHDPSASGSAANTDPDTESEIGFIQTEPLVWDANATPPLKAELKGTLIINGIRKAVVLQASLNKLARRSKTTKVNDDGMMNLGLSLHTPLQPADYTKPSDTPTPAAKDDMILMVDIIAAR